MKKKVKLIRNNSKKTLVNIPSNWLINLGINIESDSMDEIELVYDDKKKCVVIRRSDYESI